MLAVQWRECRLFLCPSWPIFCFSFGVLQEAEAYRGAKLWARLWHQESFGQACYAAPGGFTATSVVHSKKKHFFTEKTQKSTLDTSDKQVVAGKIQPSTLCLPFPQHLKAFLVLDMSHWKSPLSNDALPPGLFFQTPFDATLSTTLQSPYLVFPVPQCTKVRGIRGRKVKRAPILGSKRMYCWWAGLQRARLLENITHISMVWILIAQAVFAVRNYLYLSSGANMGESGGCVSRRHLDRIKIPGASPGLEEIRGWAGNRRLTWHHAAIRRLSPDGKGEAWGLLPPWVVHCHGKTQLATRRCEYF